MASKSVHMAVSFRNPAVAHYYGYLMQRFRKQSPEIPVVVRASQVGFGISFYGVIQIGKFHRVTKKEHRSIVSNQIPNSFIGIELQCKTTDITLGIGSTSFT